MQIQETQSVPNKVDPKTTPSHIIIKISGVKQRILKAAREMQTVTYKEFP